MQPFSCQWPTAMPAMAKELEEHRMWLTRSARARRLKREEQRIAKEMEEREQEEARKLLEQANTKKGVRKLNIADGAPIDKATLMNQVKP